MLNPFLSTFKVEEKLLNPNQMRTAIKTAPPPIHAQYLRGTFYSVTGGQWIFVLDKSGKKAYRRKITIGRQNPQYYEVIEGLEPGEQVIVSGYEAYKDNEILMLN